MTETEQVLTGDPAEAGTYECVDCARRLEIASPTDSMPACDSDEGHHKSHAWQRVDPNSPAREITGESPPEAND
jgi:hypothetical protein